MSNTEQTKYYISAASTISHQDTFQKSGFSGTIGELGDSSVPITPDYKQYIDAGLLRRMSKILRMSVACSKDCLAQAGLEQPDAIVTGTGLGCLQDTEKFLSTSLTVEGLLPPTSFIQSTHNTMAGQISLSLGNHGYNMTHTQNTISFEHALVDAMLLLHEDAEQVLVGSADEYIEILSGITSELGYQPDYPLTSGASFFTITNERNNGALAEIKACEAIALVEEPVAALKAFLEDNNLAISQVDRILYASPGHDPLKSDSEMSGLNIVAEKCINYLPLSGVYPTASAFALNYAVDMLSQDRSLQNILIFNALRKDNLGLTLVQAVEA